MVELNPEVRKTGLGNTSWWWFTKRISLDCIWETCQVIHRNVKNWIRNTSGPWFGKRVSLHCIWETCQVIYMVDWTQKCGKRDRKTCLDHDFAKRVSKLHSDAWKYLTSPLFTNVTTKKIVLPSENPFCFRILSSPVIHSFEPCVFGEPSSYSFPMRSSLTPRMSFFSSLLTLSVSIEERIDPVRVLFFFTLQKVWPWTRLGLRRTSPLNSAPNRILIWNQYLVPDSFAWGYASHTFPVFITLSNVLEDYLPHTRLLYTTNGHCPAL